MRPTKHAFLKRATLALSCVAGLAAFAGGASAEPAPLISNIDHRQQISLNGKWKYLIDRYEQGQAGFRAIWRDTRPRDKSDRVEYSFDQATTLWVPGDWNSQADKLFWYEGTIWYRRQFEVPKDMASKRLFVYFDGANYLTKVYLNGSKLGDHEGGFTPFNFEVTDKLTEGLNTLIVGVSNTRLSDGIPGKVTDWFNFGGLTRDVRLVAVDPVFIRDYSLQLKKDSADEIAGWIQTDGNQRPDKVTVAIDALDIRQDFNVDTDGRANVAFKVKNLVRWSPDNPKRYTVTITAGPTSVTEPIGFRTIQTRGTDILLNGEPIFLRGICLHEENSMAGSRAWSLDDARRVVGWAKEMNCNFMRLAHYPHNENIVRYAEEQGVLLWEELPLYWGIDWDNETVYNKAKQQMGEVITRDKNRANVIIWSICNETSPGKDRNAFLNNLAGFVRERDNTRLISAALKPYNRKNADGHTDHNRMVVDDALGETLDIIAVNEYEGWYGSTPEVCKDKHFAILFDKPLIISEMGAGALSGYHADRETRWTEEYQRWFYEENLAMLGSIPQMRGITPWILVDFQSPLRLLPSVQDGWNRKGLISERGDKKQAFYVLQQYYQQKKNAAAHAVEKDAE